MKFQSIIHFQSIIQIKQSLGWEHAIREFNKIATNIYLLAM